MENRMKANYLLWDCDSSLYDSVELKSFQRRLNSAIFSSRSLSMPRDIDRHCTVCTNVTAPAAAFSKKASTSKILPRTLQKLIRSIFKSKASNNDNIGSRGSSYVINFQRFGVLATIPEIPENLCNLCINGGAEHGANRSLMIRRSASHRLSTAAAAGISCAEA